MILFLDFDGVLHPLPCKDKELLCFIPRLETVLRDFPDVQVVISSLWRASHDLYMLQNYFSDDIRPRIIGVTPFGDCYEYESNAVMYLAKVRHAEILLWIEQNAYTGPWVALDDAWREFPDPCLNLVKCDTEAGFDRDTERVLRAHLNGHRACLPIV